MNAPQLRCISFRFQCIWPIRQEVQFKNTDSKRSASDLSGLQDNTVFLFIVLTLRPNPTKQKQAPPGFVGNNPSRRLQISVSFGWVVLPIKTELTNRVVFQHQHLLPRCAFLILKSNHAVLHLQLSMPLFKKQHQQQIIRLKTETELHRCFVHHLYFLWPQMNEKCLSCPVIVHLILF